MTSSLRDVRSFVGSKWRNRMVQLSVYSGVLFYIVANPTVFKIMEGLLPSKITSINQLVVHSLLFAVLMFLGTRLVFDPLLQDL